MRANNPFILPSGVITPYGGSTAPDGFLLCDGSSLLRADYAALFAIIGVLYGSVDATHFTLPDLRQRFPLGKAAAGTGATQGGTGGNIDHDHTITHTHQVDPPATNTGTSGATVAATPLLGSASQSNHVHSVDIPAFTSGASSAANSGTNNAPFQVVQYIIKT